MVTTIKVGKTPYMMTCPYCEEPADVSRTITENGQPTRLELRCGHAALMNPFYAGGHVNDETNKSAARDPRRLVALDDEQVLAHFAGMREAHAPGESPHPGKGDVGRVAAVLEADTEYQEEQLDTMEWESPVVVPEEAEPAEVVLLDVYEPIVEHVKQAHQRRKTA